MLLVFCMFFFFFQAEDGIRDWSVTGVQTCALPICDDRLGRSTEAIVTSTANITTSGAVLVKSDVSNIATAFTPGGTAGGATLAILVPFVFVTGDTRARVDGTIASSSSMTIQAIGENVASADIIVAGFSVIGVTGAVGSATVSTNVEAIVGATGSIGSSGAVRIEAKLKGDNNKVHAEAFSGSFGGVGAGTLIGGIAKMDGDVRARVDGDVTSSLTLDILADGHSEATAQTSVLSLGLGFSGSGSRTLAYISG